MHETVNPPGWPRPKGYSNAVIATGKSVHVAGQIGWNAQEQFESDDFTGQVRQALSNIVAVLDAAGAKPEHIVRMTWYVTDKREYLDNLAAVGEAYRDLIGKVFPAMTLVQIAALVEDRAKVEIEVTAAIPAG